MQSVESYQEAILELSGVVKRLEELNEKLLLEIASDRRRITRIELLLHDILEDMKEHVSKSEFERCKSEFETLITDALGDIAIIKRKISDIEQTYITSDIIEGIKGRLEQLGRITYNFSQRIYRLEREVGLEE